MSFFRLAHANSTQRQRAQRIKGGHSASSPAMTAEKTGRTSVLTVKCHRGDGDGGDGGDRGDEGVPSGEMAYKALAEGAVLRSTANVACDS